MWEWLMQWEGRAYENDPDDSGGATKFGIDQRSHPKENIKNLTESRAKEIYFKEYWTRYGCEGRPYPLGEVVFNCCVNAGWGRVQKIFATGVKTASGFLDEQEAFYKRLAAARPKDRKFLKGWLNRTGSLRKKLGVK